MSILKGIAKCSLSLGLVLLAGSYSAESRAASFSYITTLLQSGACLSYPGSVQELDSAAKIDSEAALQSGNLLSRGQAVYEHKAGFVRLNYSTRSDEVNYLDPNSGADVSCALAVTLNLPEELRSLNAGYNSLAYTTLVESDGNKAVIGTAGMVGLGASLGLGLPFSMTTGSVKTQKAWKANCDEVYEFLKKELSSGAACSAKKN